MHGRGVPLSVRMFLIILLCIIIPLYLVFGYVKAGYEKAFKEEISAKIIQNISKSGESINLTLQKMANISNVLVFSDDLNKAFSASQQDYYANMLTFDTVVSNLVVNNLYDTSDVIITVFDQQERLYTNWSINYNDYAFLLKEEWVRESVLQQGHIVWDMFSPPYIIEDDREAKYISLARSMQSYGVVGDYLATVIISIRQDTLSDLLLQYTYNEDDCIFICGPDGSEPVLKYDLHHAISADVLREVQKKVEDGSGSMTISAGKKRYLVSDYTFPVVGGLDEIPFRVYYFTDYQRVENQLAQIFNWATLCVLAAFILAVFLSGVIVNRIVQPVKLLAKHMDEYSLEEQNIQLDMDRQDEIGSLNRSFYAMNEKIRNLFIQLNREYEVKEKYRFESLRAQLTPHFLFNTLNTIRWMAIIRKADNITESIDALTNMLKYSMNRGSELVSLKEELNHIKDYVYIQNCRYGDRIDVQMEVDDSILQCKVIKFILQPVVENAVMHAFSGSDNQGIVRIIGEIVDENLILYVKDNGVGMSAEMREHLLDMDEDLHQRGKRLTGIGLKNVNERIRVAYGEAYGLQIESSEGEGTAVIYTLPLLGKEDTDEAFDDCR